MKTNIALIGFMGTGKSVVGKALAEKLGKTLVDTDSVIEIQAGKTISKIFEEEGESEFRKKEKEVVATIAAKKNQIIACGGGVVLNKDNIFRLKQSSIMIWLTASPEIITQRISEDGDGRPLLQGKKTIPEIKSLMLSRKKFYESAADIKIDTSELNIRTLSEQIINKLRENADFNS